MLAFKRFVTVVVMVYLLLALLFLLVPSVQATVADMGAAPTPDARLTHFFQVLTWIGVGVLALHLLSENADSALLRRSVSEQDMKINELKAKLYDQQQRATAAAAAPPAAPVPTRFPDSNVPPTPLA